MLECYEKKFEKHYKDLSEAVFEKFGGKNKVLLLLILYIIKYSSVGFFICRNCAHSKKIHKEWLQQKINVLQNEINSDLDLDLDDVSTEKKPKNCYKII